MRPFLHSIPHCSPPPPHTHTLHTHPYTHAPTHPAQIYDVAAGKRTRTMGGHRQRVSTQAWASALLVSGSRDRTVLQRDVRAPEEYVARLVGHKSEVCGLRVSGGG